MDLSLLREQCFVAGHWIDSLSSETIKVHNPSDGSLIGSVPDLGNEEVVQAIQAASTVFGSWSTLPAKERSKYLYRWYELMLEHQEELAYIMTIEQGKPLIESRGEILYAASFIQWFAEEGKRAYGDVIPATLPGKRFITIKQAVGPVSAITPWNFPSAMITRKAAPALAAGCPIVIKPSSLTPFSALALAALAEKAGFPKGTISVVTGDAKLLGYTLTTHPLIRKFSFTGSTEIGKQLMAQASSTMKRLSLELGGNAPFIVFEDADLAQAVEGAIACKFRNAGQTCVCANRIYVHEQVYDVFLTEFTKAAQALKVGDGRKDGVRIGPLINQNAIEKIKKLIDQAVSMGATVKLGGKTHELGGLFFEPTILTNVNDQMDMSCQEIFGPVAAIYKFKTTEEVIQRANATQYGLASYFYSQDVNKVFKVSEALQYGMVGINTGIISTEVSPFGGVKESGMGREGSKYGLDEYLDIKYLSLGLS